MKKNILLLVLLTSVFSFADTQKSISGKITLAKGADKDLKSHGALFIFAKKAGQESANGTPPLAVLRVVDPQFPYDFSLSAENAMMPGTPFEGPFAVYARYSPSGDALDKSGPQGVAGHAKDKIMLGQKNLHIELKKK